MKSAVDEIAHQIRAQIVESDLNDGDRLPAERDLAEALGYSRPIVRQGIQRLHDLGIVETRRGAGTFYTPVDLIALTEVRLRLEPWAAAEAALHRSTEQAQRLVKLSNKIESVLDDPRRWAVVDTDFHRIVARASGNSVLASVLNGLADVLATSRAHTVSSRSLRELALVDLTLIAASISDRDAANAEDAMRVHVARVLPFFPESQD